MHQVQGKAGTANSRSSQSTLSDRCSTKEMGLIESVCEDEEMNLIFMVADVVAINQLSMDGAHMIVDSRVSVHVCPNKLCHSCDSASTADMLARF